MTGSQEPWDHPSTGTCTRAHLAQRLHEEGFDRRRASRLVSALLDLMREGLGDEGSLKLAGFGTLSVVERAARIGRNLSTGEVVPVPGHRSVVFKPAPALRARLDQALGAQEAEQ